MSADGKCTFWMEKKKRNCRFDAKPGYAYCGNHMPEGLVPGMGRRVPCPINPNHLVLETDLKQHMLKCPERLLRDKQKVHHPLDSFALASSLHSPPPSLPLPLPPLTTRLGCPPVPPCTCSLPACSVPLPSRSPVFQPASLAVLLPVA